ncbi:MAG: ABC transporter permease [Planctomycetes bacterium]|nr:ABC transporter permease [Planctomycetota bacterium]MCB9890849.1 ABC transporter permease [Planctomycetota bacterium]
MDTTLFFARRLLLDRRMLFYLLILGGGCAIAFGLGTSNRFDGRQLWAYQRWAGPLMMSTAALLVPLLFGAATFSAEYERHTIVLLLTRPRSRVRTVIEKYVAVLAVTCVLVFLAVVVPGVILFASAGGTDLATFTEEEVQRLEEGTTEGNAQTIVHMDEIAREWLTTFESYAVASLLAALAYTSVFFFLSARFKNPILIGLVLSLAWDVFIANLQGNLKQVTVQCHLQDYLLHTLGQPRWLFGQHLKPIHETSADAIVVLLCIAAGFLLLTLQHFRSKQIT